jgi:hypothetical protein
LLQLSNLSRNESYPVIGWYFPLPDQSDTCHCSNFAPRS